MKVREIANRAGVDAHVVRFYTRIGLLHPDRDPHSGYRQYRQSDIRLLRFIHQAQSLGYTLKEIAQILEETGRGESPCPTVRRIIQRRVKENRERLAELLRLQERMELALVQWSRMPDGAPTGESICHLIETAIAAREDRH